MDLYESISEYYDEIFPLDPAKAPFVQSLVPKPSQRILDLGCSTGALALALGREGHRVSGIDLNERMIAIAKSRAAEEVLDVSFHVLDMMEIDKHFDTGSLDQVLCFGNTLVHLHEPNDIRRLLKTVYRLTGPGGVFVAQILNYDRILDQGIRQLPIIEGESFRFLRSYELENTGRILFKTELELKHAQNSFNDITPLYPLRFEELKDMLEGAGFRSYRFYSGYEGNDYTLEDFALIAVGHKRH